MIGAKLGPYRIVASLGAGGMCEVYRARDERLGRDVAVNVLPRAVADDPERLARFRRLLDRVRPEWERFTPRFQPAD